MLSGWRHTGSQSGLSPYLQKPDGGEESGMAQLPDGPVEWPGSVGLIHDPPQINPTGRSAADLAAPTAETARPGAGTLCASRPPRGKDPEGPAGTGRAGLARSGQRAEGWAGLGWASGAAVATDPP